MRDGRGTIGCAAVFLCGLFLATLAHAQGTAPDDTAYVLALSWEPAFCASKAGADRRECAGTSAQERLVLHGLWPNADRNGDGRINEGDDYCLPDRARIMVLDRNGWEKLPAVDISPALRLRLEAVMPGLASGLERHQWVKHGTCSGLTAERYFAAAADLAETFSGSAVARFLSDRAGQTIARRQLLAAFASAFGQDSDRAVQLICQRENGVSRLSEIRLRLRGDAIARTLTRTSFDTRQAAKGSCAAMISIVPD